MIADGITLRPAYTRQNSQPRWLSLSDSGQKSSVPTESVTDVINAANNRTNPGGGIAHRLVLWHRPSGRRPP